MFSGVDNAENPPSFPQAQRFQEGEHLATFRSTLSFPESKLSLATSAGGGNDHDRRGDTGS